MNQKTKMLLIVSGTLLLVAVAVGAYLMLRNKDKFLFEVTPAKRCCGGIWKMGDPNSKLYKYCSDPDNKMEIAQVCCGAGFSGRPVHWEYTPESNADWANTRCQNFSYDSPCVL